MRISREFVEELPCSERDREHIVTKDAADKIGDHLLDAGSLVEMRGMGRRREAPGGAS